MKKIVSIFVLVGIVGCKTVSLPHPEPSVVSKSNQADRIHEGPVVLSSVMVLATGDILMHGAVKKSAEKANQKNIFGNSKNFSGYKALFEDVASEIAGADIAFANLETPVAPKADQGTRAFVFNAPVDLLGAIKNLGFDVVSCANNHAYDQGRAGLKETLAMVEKAGLTFIGAGQTKKEAQTPIIYDVNGIRVAFLGYSQVFNNNLNVEDPNEAVVNELEISQVDADVKEARSKSDFVVVSIHWGIEYNNEQPQSNKDMAKKIFEAGADVILGHHPHVLQPLEVYQASDGRRCMVIYSLGNFISNQSRFFMENISPDEIGDTRDGIFLHFNIEKRDYGQGIIQTELAKVFYLPIWTENEALKSSGTQDPHIRVISMDRAREKIRARLAQISKIKDQKGSLNDEETKEYIETQRTLELLSQRRKAILDRLGDEYSVPWNTFNPSIEKKTPVRLNLQ